MHAAGDLIFGPRDPLRHRVGHVHLDLLAAIRGVVGAVALYVHDALEELVMPAPVGTVRPFANLRGPPERREPYLLDFHGLPPQNSPGFVPVRRGAPGRPSATAARSVPSSCPSTR